MTDTFRPTDPVALADFVAAARADRTALRIDGHSSKRAIGHDVASERMIETGGFSGIALYEPEELVLSAGAGTPVATIEAALAERNQALAFEPMDYGPLLGQPAGRGTLGGLVAANLAGPRRIAKGAARDHMLGLEAVTGRGELFKAGGRVVKNVTGYDLARGLTGSWGTLAILTSATLKVLPAPEASLSLAIPGLSPERAAEAMAAAMGSNADASGAAHAPDAARLAAGHRPGAMTLIRLEGTPRSIAARRDHLAALLKPFGRSETIDDASSRALWHAIRDVRPFWPDFTPGRDVWRVSVAPMSGWRVAAEIADAEALFDWQGGLVWLAVPAGSDGAAIRAAIARHGGGHATLIRADEGTRSRVAVFQPQPGALGLLARRLKEQFDPAGILEPGRMGGKD